MERVEHIDGLYNFRDLGGIRADGGQVRSGLLYRSEALYGLTDRGEAPDGGFPDRSRA